MKTHTLLTATLLSILLISCKTESGEMKDKSSENIFTDSSTHDCTKHGGWGHIDIPETTTDVLAVRGLGNFNPDSLSDIAKYIENFYGYSCQIQSPVPTTTEMYSSTGILDASRALTELKGVNIKTIFVTNENLYDRDLDLKIGRAHV